MSARGRGTTPEPDEFYATPAWAVHRLLDTAPFLAFRGKYVEPCVGDGAIVAAVESWRPDSGCPAGSRPALGSY